MAAKKEMKNVGAKATPATLATPATPAPVPSAAPVSTLPDMRRFSIKKRVTMPTLNPGVNQPYVLKITSAFRTSTYKGPDANKEKPATVCDVIDMATGAVFLWIVSEVAHKNISEQYGDDYVGRIFAIQKLPKRPGKRYFDFDVAELSDDGEEGID